jgi:hypothetical protein
MKTLRSLSVPVLVAGALLATATGCSRLKAESEQPLVVNGPAQAESHAIVDRLENSSSGRRELPAGTSIRVRLAQDVDSGSASVGDNVDATVADPVSVDGAVVVPAGARVSGEVDAVQSAKHFGGQAMISVRFTSVEAQGADVEVSGSMSSSEKSQKGKDTAVIAGSAAGGAILGKVLGGDTKDAVAGAVVGGGIGTAVASRKGDEALLPAGTTTTVTTVRTEDIRRVD